MEIQTKLNIENKNKPMEYEMVNFVAGRQF
jgi:hypothetical protein